MERDHNWLIIQEKILSCSWLRTQLESIKFLNALLVIFNSGTWNSGGNLAQNRRPYGLLWILFQYPYISSLYLISHLLPVIEGNWVLILICIFKLGFILPALHILYSSVLFPTLCFLTLMSLRSITSLSNFFYEHKHKIEMQITEPQIEF
jgi:hypothetical protein